MADLEFYRLSMTGAEADGGIRTGMDIGSMSGIVYADGGGGVSAAEAGVDYGFPLLKGYGVPTNNVAASIGQHYFDMAATAFPYEYICIGYTANGFVWKVYGDTNDGFIILGYFPSYEDLEAAISGGVVEAPAAGAAYGIGTAAPYDIYVWDELNQQWVNNGPLGASGGGGSGVPPHGTTGQALVKYSDVDYDAGWGQVGSVGIAPGAVTTEKLADGSVTAEKLANGAIPDALGYTPGMVNPNLIDNWYFVGGGSQQGGGQFPINQRGQTSYSGTGYGIDRWTDLGATATIALQASGMEINASGQNFQYIEPSRMLNGAVYTISSIVDGELYSHTFLYDNTEASGTAHFVSCGQKANLVFYVNLFSSGNNAVGFNQVTQKVESIAIKLERASRQTLAHQENGVWVLNEIPDFGEQLARCQRDQIELRKQDYSPIGVAYAESDSLLLCYIPVPVTLRAAPSIAMSGTANASGLVCSSPTLAGYGANGIYVRFSTSGATAGKTYLVDTGALCSSFLLVANL